MAISREDLINSINDENMPTKAPLLSNKDLEIDDSTKTADQKEISKEYEISSETKDKIDTGTFVPKDMRVRLVRADSATAETILSILSSVALTMFGVFIGSWMTLGEAFSIRDIIATSVLGIFSLVFLVLWGILKYKQFKDCIPIPYEAFSLYKADD